jgi:hypothetical protein
MANRFSRKSTALVAVGLAMGLLVGVGMMIGTLCAVRANNPGQLVLPETVLHAEACTNCETMAVATGVIDDDVEGFYTLDFLTGELQCFVLYAKGPRAQKLGGLFKASVPVALGGVEQGKKPHYLLVTGKANFAGVTTQVRPAYSVAYVVDTNSGKFVAFGIPWNRASPARGTIQEAQMVVLAQGLARTAAIRE